MLQKLGYVLVPTVEVQLVYKGLLLNCNTTTVEECNELLTSAGYEPLTKVEV